MPKVTVIVPIYGVEKYIERCANSLFAQTLSDMEFIFIDDCTPDKSVEILERCIEKNRPREAGMNWSVRIVRMPANGGLPAVRRHGIQLATGEFIAHCDSDDWVEPDMYQVLYETAVRNNYDAVVCGYYFNSEKMQLEKSDRIAPEKSEYLKGLVVKTNISAVWNKLCKRSLYKEDFIYPKGNMGEDLVITIQTVYNATRVGYVDKCLYHYFYNESSITNVIDKEKILKRTEQSIDNGNLIATFLEKVGLRDSLRFELDYLKLRKKNNYLQLFDEAKYRKAWVETDMEINKRIFWNRYMDLRMRVEYLRAWMIVLLKGYKA